MINAVRLNGITDESDPTLGDNFQSLVQYGELYQLAEIHFTATANRIAPSRHNPVTPKIHRTEAADACVIPHISLFGQYRILIYHHPESTASFNQSGGTSSTRYYCQTIASSPAYSSPPSIE
ncbi:hypothetical protein TNCV_1395791 [Trichonephila clavipes]|nr:hypothetical protein TNCV_1395791 [Trichonephila clavipes]